MPIDRGAVGEPTASPPGAATTTTTEESVSHGGGGGGAAGTLRRTPSAAGADAAAGGTSVSAAATVPSSPSPGPTSPSRSASTDGALPLSASTSAPPPQHHHARADSEADADDGELPADDGPERREPWAYAYVPEEGLREVTLLKPATFAAELEVRVDVVHARQRAECDRLLSLSLFCHSCAHPGQTALSARKGRLWRTKQLLIREQPTLFWNLVWWYAAVGLPFELPALLHLANKNGAQAYISGIDGRLGNECCGRVAQFTH